MKAYAISILLAASCLAANAEFSKEEQKQLEETEISGVRADSIKNDAHEKFETLEVNTFQNQDSRQVYQIQIAAELKDAEKNLYLVEFKANQPEGLDSEYTGEDYWQLSVPDGEMKRLKFEAYAIHYGVMDGDTFMLLAEDYRGVKTMEELKEEAKTPFPGDVKLKHSYMYEDQQEGETQTIYRTLKAVKQKSVGE